MLGDNNNIKLIRADHGDLSPFSKLFQPVTAFLLTKPCQTEKIKFRKSCCLIDNQPIEKQVTNRKTINDCISIYPFVLHKLNVHHRKVNFYPITKLIFDRSFHHKLTDERGIKMGGLDPLKTKSALLESIANVKAEADSDLVNFLKFGGYENIEDVKYLRGLIYKYLSVIEADVKSSFEYKPIKREAG